jgi:hypothetical protein
MNDSDEHARKFREAAHKLAVNESQNWICVNCGKQNQSNRQDCWKCRTSRHGTPTKKRGESGEMSNLSGEPLVTEMRDDSVPTADSRIHTHAPETREVRALMSRYWDAYVVTQVTVGIGEVIKATAIGLAAIIILGALLLASQVSGGSAAVIFLLGLGAAAVVGGLFYLLGLIVMAQGQILKASLDGAVNTSPFLENEHRAKIMSLK